MGQPYVINQQLPSWEFGFTFEAIEMAYSVAFEAHCNVCVNE